MNPPPIIKNCELQLEIKKSILNQPDFLDDGSLEVSSFDDALLEKLMNSDVKKALKLNSTWGAQSSVVFSALWEDFMKPVIDKGDKSMYFFYFLRKIHREKIMSNQKQKFTKLIVQIY